jgi:hypothetical protein
MNNLEKEKVFGSVFQFAIPILTIASQVVISLKSPEYGLIIGLTAQPFWLYSSWKAYKEAGQAGILVNTVVVAILILGGVINYWFL